MMPDEKLLARMSEIISDPGHPLMAAALGVIREEIRCSPHTAQHYFAQTHLRNGLDIYSVSSLLGHENVNITKRYLQSLQDSSIVEMAVKTSPLRNLKT